MVSCPVLYLAEWGWLMMLCSPTRGSAQSDIQRILVTCSRLTKMATASFLMVAVLSVAHCTVFGAVVRGKSLRLRSVTVSFRLSQYPREGVGGSTLWGILSLAAGQCVLV